MVSIKDLFTNLNHYYNCDDSELTTVEDTIGNNDLTLSGASQTSNYIDFDGSDDTALSSNEYDMPFGTDNWTWSFWMQPNQNGVGEAGVIISTKHSINNLRIIITEAGQLRIFMAGSDSGNFSAGITADGTTWYHLSIVKTGSTLTVYVDNELKKTLTGFSGSITRSNLVVSGDWVGDNDYRGKIKLFGIWHRALSLADIKTLYNNSAGLKLVDDNRDAKTSGTAEISSKYPVKSSSGVGANDYHKGRKINLIAQKKSLVPLRKKRGL